MKAKLLTFLTTYIYVTLKHGQNIPRGYGWADYDLKTDRVIVMPLFLNLIYSGAMNFYHSIIEGFQSREHSYTYKTGRQVGEVAGMQFGYARGYMDAKNGKPNQLTQMIEQQQSKA